MAEMHPPHSDVNPMRAIFLIPMAPPPTLAEPRLWYEFFTFSYIIYINIKKNINI